MDPNFEKLLKKHKIKAVQDSSVADGVQKRLQEKIKHRKSSRLPVYDSLRDIPKHDNPAPMRTAQLMTHLLDQWKEEKEKKKEKAALLKQKPFIAGVPHTAHKYLPIPPPPIPMPSTSGSATRSQSVKTTAVEPKEAKAVSSSFAPINASFKPPHIKTLTTIPQLSKRVHPKSKKYNITFDPILPTTQKATGKQARPAKGLLDEDTSTFDSVHQFRRQLASEIKRITEMCETWDMILEQTVLPETVQETVLSVVGHARLLMSHKPRQFASLVERCARPEPGAALITPADLHGVYDMLFMEVQSVDMRFKKLEELRLCGWVEDQPVEVKKKVVRPTVNVKKAAKPTAGSSLLKEIIAAGRKAKKEQESTPQPPSGDRKTFEAGFFSVSSLVCTPDSVPSSPALTPGSTSSPLKAVLSSRSKWASAIKNSTSFAMLRASVLGKNVECDGSSLLPQTQAQATSGHSIDKNCVGNTEKKSSRKTTKMVNRSDAELQDETYNTPESETNEQKTDEIQNDSAISSMDLDKVENKENSRRPKLVRQVAEDSGTDE